MCRYCQTIVQRMCCLCDTLLAGTVCLGGMSTATTTALQYTGHIDDWRAVAIPSVVTFVAIMGCMLRCACRAQTQTSVQSSTIIINHHTQGPTTNKVPTESAIPVRYPLHEVIELHEATPMEEIEMTVQPSIPLQKNDVIQQIHNEWRRSREKL